MRGFRLTPSGIRCDVHLWTITDIVLSLQIPFELENLLNGLLHISSQEEISSPLLFSYEYYHVHIYYFSNLSFCNITLPLRLCHKSGY